MGRIITKERLDQIAKAREADPKAIGPTLAEIVLDGNVPVEGIASALNVSEPTVYRWMYGHSSPRDADKIVKIQRLLTVLRKAKRGKDLPLAGNTKERIAMLYKLVVKYKPAAKS
jgi:hypothetical protein